MTRNSILRYLMIFAGVILLGHGCWTVKYNIVGHWLADAIVEGQLKTASLTFTGDRETGTCTMTSEGEQYSGTYSASDKDVDFSFEYQGMTVLTFEGSFVDEDNLSGTGISDWGSGAESLTWTARRKD